MNTENIINIKSLEQIKSLLEQEYRKFKTYSYNIFNSSYLKNNSDVYIKIMSSNLENLYKNIDDAYINIINWLDSYINDAYSIELYLSEESRLGMVEESVIRNYLDNKIPMLPNFKNEHINIFNGKE